MAHLPTPHFPIAMFLIACIKELLDFLTIGFFGWFFALLFTLCLFIGNMLKPYAIRRHTSKTFTKRVAIMFLISIVPVVNFFPESVMTVLFIYKDEKAFVKKRNKKHRLRARHTGGMRKAVGAVARRFPAVAVASRVAS